MDCELCDNLAWKKDSDMGFWLCHECYGAFNGTVVDVDFNEVW